MTVKRTRRRLEHFPGLRRDRNAVGGRAPATLDIQAVTIDGKTSERYLNLVLGRSASRELHAWPVDQPLLMGQLAVDGKYNEITAVPKPVETLSLEGCIVIADALNCRLTIAAKGVEQGAGSFLALKGNQGSLHDDVRRFISDPQRLPDTAHRTGIGEPGCVETWTSMLCTDTAW